MRLGQVLKQNRIVLTVTRMIMMSCMCQLWNWPIHSRHEIINSLSDELIDYILSSRWWSNILDIKNKKNCRVTVTCGEWCAWWPDIESKKSYLKSYRKITNDQKIPVQIKKPKRQTQTLAKAIDKLEIQFSLIRYGFLTTVIRLISKL